MKIKHILVSIPLVLICYAFNSSIKKETPSNQFVVVLDAGHGGKDPGNTGNNYKEKSIALKIALAVGAALEKDPGIKVIYTRKTDVFVELKDRAKIANKAKADLFVSIHCDAHNSSAFGAGTFVLGLHASERNFQIAKKENSVIYLEDDYEQKYDGFDPNATESLIGLTLMQEEYLDQSILLASLIQDNFANKIKRKDRQVKQAGFWVLHNTYMPSVLVETGFLTNKNEGAYLNSKKGQQEMAVSITEAIKKYQSKLNKTTFNDPILTQESHEAIEDKVSDYFFCVQIAASSKKTALKSYNFNGLDKLSSRKEKGLFKYYYGKVSSYEIAKKMQKEARDKGYTSAFIIALKNDVKVPIAEALKSTSN